VGEGNGGKTQFFLDSNKYPFVFVRGHGTGRFSTRLVVVTSTVTELLGKLFTLLTSYLKKGAGEKNIVRFCVRSFSRRFFYPSDSALGCFERTK
jgi:hypothetical protein